ncbi:MAG: hypothetical protein ACIAQZ_16310 [Sedimentisphaeraceae bacterium JB056]
MCPNYTPGIEVLIIPIVIFFFAAIMNILFVIIPFWLIFKKAGFAGPLALLMLLPVANIVMLFVLAFSDWPALRDKRNASPKPDKQPPLEGEGSVI